jgi:hypothetical protein
MDSRDAVDGMNQAAATHGGRADVNPLEDLGFMYSRDLADPDSHLWGVIWMDPAAIPPAQRGYAMVFRRQGALGTTGHVDTVTVSGAG